VQRSEPQGVLRVHVGPALQQDARDVLTPGRGRDVQRSAPGLASGIDVRPVVDQDARQLALADESGLVKGRLAVRGVTRIHPCSGLQERLGRLGPTTSARHQKRRLACVVGALEAGPGGDELSHGGRRALGGGAV